MDLGLVCVETGMQEPPARVVADEDGGFVSWPICRRGAVNRLLTGIVTPAWKRGFCRSNAASRVEPERGRPAIK
jgi:hypothetical protein